MQTKEKWIALGTVLLCLSGIAPAQAGSSATAAGVGVVAATKSGHSPIYHLDVMCNGRVAGQVVVNTSNAQLPSYVLVARGLTPNTKYTFGYTVAGEASMLGTKDTPAAGALVIHGTFPLDAVEDLESAQFWMMETPPGYSGDDIYSLSLVNYGLFIAQLACYYSTDGGVTWQESAHTGNIVRFDYKDNVSLWTLGVPDGALVKIHAIVVAGKDRTGSQVFHYVNDYLIDGSLWTASYEVYGATLTSKLQYDGLYRQNP